MTGVLVTHSTVPGLAYTVTPVLCLFVIVRIAVDVMQNDNISRGEVDAQATGTR